MAFLFGKKKGAHGHREGTPPGPTATTGSGTSGQTPSSSVGTLNSLHNGSGATSASQQDQRPAAASPPNNSSPMNSVPRSMGPLQQMSGKDIGMTSSQQQQGAAPVQKSQAPPSQVNPANSALYPWSQRRLTLSSSHPSPFPRYGHAANGVAGKDGDVYIMGGLIRSQTVRGDLWMIEGGGSQLAAYPVVTTSEGPGPRVGHASLLVGNAFIVFGGDTKLDPADVLDETLYLLNTSTRQWSRANTHGARPAGRYGHTINILGSKLYIFGGQVDGFFFNDLVAFDLNTLQSNNARWEELISANEKNQDVPASRTNHTVVTWMDKLYLFGGTNGLVWFNDVWSYDPQTNQWTQLDCIGYIPSPREGHAASLVGDVMYIFGGRTSEGDDLGDLAAFRISSRRWYTFQNMGPSPSRRSGHSMTTCGQKIIVLGGEPSVPTRNQEELQLIYILDTAKIRYPNDHQNQSSTSPTGSNENKRLQGAGARNGSVDSPGAQTSRKNGGTGTRESVTAGPTQSTPPNGPNPLTSNNTSGGSVTSRLPRVAQGTPAGPPPNQQAPPPRTNGSALPGQRSRTPTGNGTLPKTRDVTSPVQERPSPTAANGTRNPTAQRKASGQDTVVAGRERSGSRQQGPNPNLNGTTDSNHSPTSSATTQPINSMEKPKEQPKEQRSRGSKGSSSGEGDMLREFQKLKHMNEWYASELALARRAGYTIQTGNNAILEERGADSLLEEERPFVEAMLILKGELQKVQGSVDEQAAQAARKIQEVERQRDVAVQEAVYAKAKLAALGGNSTPTPGDRSADMANMDAEKMTDMSRKLAASLAAQAELSAKVEVLKAEISAERKARHLADETAGVAQSRVSELDDFRNRAASEMESLRAELLDAERAFRDEAAAGADATADAKLLRIDQDELSMKLQEALEDNNNYHNSMDEMRNAMDATASRTATLSRQLEEERLVKEGLERKLAQVKSEYEEKAADLENANTRLRDVEELMEKYAEEARAANAALAAGLQKVADREIMTNTALTDERVKALQEQVESAKSLLKKSKDQADDTGEKLAQAMQRVAGLEFQQGQASKDAIALRRRMAESLDEVRKLKQDNAEIQARLVERQLEVDSISAKHAALKDILAERSTQVGFEKRRSAILSPSPQSGSATPEQNRLRELELRLEESLRAHRETKSTAEMQAQEVEKHFREKLEQLENDYQSAVHYVKGTEKLLKRMKDELAKNKAQNARLQLELEEFQRKGPDHSRHGSREINTEWEHERELLNKEIDDLRGKVRESATALDKQIRETKAQLDSMNETNLMNNQMKVQLMDLSQQLSETRIQLDRLENENSLLERRAQDAEERVSFLLDRVEDSVDAYRRSTLTGPNGLGGGEPQSTHSSFYGGAPDGRNSVALDSLATELDALRTHWENTNKNYRLSSTFDFEKTPTSTEGGELSSSLAQWRQKLHQEETEAAMRSDSRSGDSRSPIRSQGQGASGGVI
ncbi:uncharacterized protein H6S33_002434 [Morchella sextelata]|uniref:uncharacterized protein n=1 Tax=Morchella sextelata TaxID=1174677 RepID=UPI001D04E56E|nr:uncharacterized protein H6S33_002434 [Morchella sextelata]KAH0607400.1 hypothetical protein H6S33_002434 [Morchella sextelata]